MSRVLMIGPSSRALGGIVKVIEYYRNTPFWEEEEIVWIETHCNGNNWQKLSILSKSIIQYCLKIKRAKIAHIHFTGGTSANRKFIFFLIGKIFGLKIVSHLHTPMLNYPKIINWTFKTMVKSSDQVIVLSPAFATALDKRIKKRAYIILNNPSQGFCSDNCEKEDIILFAGRLEKKKGYQDLIEALGHIRQNNGYTVILAGNGEIQEANYLIKNHQLKNIKTVGWLDSYEMIKLYEKAKIFVLPSYGEGFPISIIDALSNKCAVITTPVGGIPDYLNDEETCLFINPGDITGLAESINKLTENEQLRTRLALNGHKLAKEVFDVRKITHKLSNIYKKLETN